MKKRFLLALLALPLTFSYTFATTKHNTSDGFNINEQKILHNAPALNPKALQCAVKGYAWALKHHQVNNPNILTVIDFNLPSDAKRVWVINLKTSQILLKTYTTQGKNSGVYYAKHFSNSCRSNETSLGVYKTLNTYYGEHGLSLRLKGLEKGMNDHAYERAIVIHPAWYAAPDFVKRFKRTGRSWGCFAINPAISKRFIELTKNGSIIFAYASQMLHDHLLNT